MHVMVSCPVVGVLLLRFTFMQLVPAMVTADVMLSLLWVKPVPTMVSWLPPAVVPLPGSMVVMVGDGREEMLVRAV